MNVNDSGGHAQNARQCWLVGDSAKVRQPTKRESWTLWSIAQLHFKTNIQK